MSGKLDQSPSSLVAKIYAKAPAVKRPVLHKLHLDIPSEMYHSIKGTYSSSQLKDILEDEEVFVNKHVHKTIAREENSAFDVGNYFHVGVLEPHKLKSDCVVYPGKIRRGQIWDKFKAKHANKTIVSTQQISKAEQLIESVRNSPIAMSYIKDGQAEVSLFVELAIFEGKIYAPKFGKVLGAYGWENGSLTPPQLKKAVIIIVKVRADCLGFDYILDLKSTTGNARSLSEMMGKVKYYNYDLSAALYLDIFSLAKKMQMEKFIWTFASKDYQNCKSYIASKKYVMVGRAKWRRAVLTLAECKKSDWTIYDSLGVMEPCPTELFYLQEDDDISFL